MKFPALLYFAANLMAQTALDVPWLGASRDSSGRIRNIYGVSGNFLAGEPAGEPVQSAAFSRQSSLIKTANGVQVRRKDGMLLAERPAEDGPALFAFVDDVTLLSHTVCATAAAASADAMLTRFFA